MEDAVEVEGDALLFAAGFLRRVLLLGVAFEFAEPAHRERAN